MLNNLGRNSLKQVPELGQSEGDLALNFTSSVRSNCAIAIVFGGVLLNLALIICLASLATYQSGSFLMQILNNRAAAKAPQVPIFAGAHEACP